MDLEYCLVTTVDYLNMRNAPAGDQILTVFRPSVTLNAHKRTTGWFQVQFSGQRGWVSADYVTTSGNCAG